MGVQNTVVMTVLSINTFTVFKRKNHGNGGTWLSKKPPLLRTAHMRKNAQRLNQKSSCCSKAEKSTPPPTHPRVQHSFLLTQQHSCKFLRSKVNYNSMRVSECACVREWEREATSTGRKEERVLEFLTVLVCVVAARSAWRRILISTDVAVSQISQKIWPRSTSFLFGQTKSMNSLQKDPRLGAGNSSSVDSRSDFKVLPENGLRVRGRRQRRVEVTHRVFKKGLTEKVKLCSGRRWVRQKMEHVFSFLDRKKLETDVVGLLFLLLRRRRLLSDRRIHHRQEQEPPVLPNAADRLKPSLSLSFSLPHTHTHTHTHTHAHTHTGSHSDSSNSLSLGVSLTRTLSLFHLADSRRLRGVKNV